MYVGVAVHVYVAEHAEYGDYDGTDACMCVFVVVATAGYAVVASDVVVVPVAYVGGAMHGGCVCCCC